MGSYEKLNEIDGAYVLTCLTGGLVLRFNPTLANERDSILYYMNYFSGQKVNENKILIANVGSELFKENDQLRIDKKCDGHSFAIVDILKTNETIFVKIRNCQTKMKIKIEHKNE